MCTCLRLGNHGELLGDGDGRLRRRGGQERARLGGRADVLLQQERQRGRQVAAVAQHRGRGLPVRVAQRLQLPHDVARPGRLERLRRDEAISCCCDEHADPCSAARDDKDEWTPW